MPYNPVMDMISKQVKSHTGYDEAWATANQMPDYSSAIAMMQSWKASAEAAMHGIFQGQETMISQGYIVVENIYSASEAELAAKFGVGAPAITPTGNGNKTLVYVAVGFGLFLLLGGMATLKKIF